MEVNLQDLNEAALRQQLGLDETWVMRDLPWMKQEYYTKLMNAIGGENMKFISGTTMKAAGSKFNARVRATIFINETGMVNLRKFAEEIHT